LSHLSQFITTNQLNQLKRSLHLKKRKPARVGWSNGPGTSIR
jgi:hypothetical protein